MRPRTTFLICFSRVGHGPNSSFFHFAIGGAGPHFFFVTPWGGPLFYFVSPRRGRIPLQKVHHHSRENPTVGFTCFGGNGPHSSLFLFQFGGAGPLSSLFHQVRPHFYLVSLRRGRAQFSYSPPSCENLFCCFITSKFFQKERTPEFALRHGDLATETRGAQVFTSPRGRAFHFRPSIRRCVERPCLKFNTRVRRARFCTSTARRRGAPKFAFTTGA